MIGASTSQRRRALDPLRIIIKDNADEAANFVANQIALYLIARPTLVMGLATGETMRPVYARLRQIFRSGEAPSMEFISFNLDEFISVPKSHPGSFHAYMESELFRHIHEPRVRCFIPDGMANDLPAEAGAFEAKIKHHGGLDIQLLGIGGNGHIGFNEPGTPFESRTSVVELSQHTRDAIIGFEANRPHRAITMGIGTIMEARHCLLLATGEAKATAVKTMLSQPASPTCPASALQSHADLMIVLDRKASSRLTDLQLLDIDPF